MTARPWRLRDAARPSPAEHMTSTVETALALAEREPDRVVATESGRELTAAEAVAEARALAAVFWADGLRPGQTLAYILPNCLEAVSLNLAAGMLGLVITPIVPIYRDAELRHILRDARAASVVSAGLYRGIDFAAILSGLRADLPELRQIVETASSWDAMLARGRELTAAPRVATAPDDVKLILYTSGTTGPAKGVLHTHRTLARVLEVGSRNLALGPEPRFLIATPIGHVTGYLWGLEAPFRLGTRVVLMRSWKPDEAVRLIDAHRIDATTGAAPFLQDTIAAARAAGTRLPSLRRFSCGGAAVSPTLIREARDAFARASAFRVYGSTEAPNIGQGYADPALVELAAETDGRPLDYEVRLVGEGGREVEQGQEGEILARGPALFRGYTDPAQNDAAFAPGGFFRTGDFGRMTPEGALVVTGRKKDLIIRGGENLSPKEIEDALLSHPAIRDVAVIGIAHPRLGETVGACVVAEPGARPDVPALAGHLARLGFARQKCPEHVFLVEALPRTASGKVRKDQLRALVAALRSDAA